MNRKFVMYEEDLGMLNVRFDRIKKKQNLENYAVSSQRLNYLSKQQLMAMVGEYEHFIELATQEELLIKSCSICGTMVQADIVTFGIDYVGSEYDENKPTVDICKDCSRK